MKPKILKPKSVSISKDAKFGCGVTIGPNVVIEGDCVIGDKVTIGANSVIVKSSIDSGTKIFCSVIEESKIGANCSLGPFARLRPHSTLADGVTIGNFVEVKKSKIGSNTNAGHLSYIGDSELGTRVNIGAGTITANFNPITNVKSKTVLQDDVKIGSNAVLVAPVTINKGANVAAGAVITKDVKSWALAITRAPLKVIENWIKH